MAENQVVSIAVRGASEGSLEDVDLDLPLGRLIVLVGRSGAGARTMAVDVLFAESRRRYMLALSPFERESLGGIGRVAVENVSGLPPAVYFGPSSVGRGVSVGSFLQIDGLLGQLFHRCGDRRCPGCGGPCRSYTEEAAAAEAVAVLGGEPSLVLAPLALESTASGPAVVAELRRAGFLRLRVAGEVVRLDEMDAVPGAWRGRDDLEVVADRLVPESGQERRLAEAIRTARAISRGRSLLVGSESGRRLVLNQRMTCVECDTSYDDVTPDDFVETGEQRPDLALQARLGGGRIQELEVLPLTELLEFLGRLGETGGLAEAIVRPVAAARDLGLDYLCLARGGHELSAGEQMRLVLARCQSSGLVGILYIFEAPMAHLEAGQAASTVRELRQLAVRGNTVLALDHAPSLLQEADEVFGFDGGRVDRIAPACLVELRGCGRRARAGPADDAIAVRWSGGPPVHPFDLEVPLHQLVCVSGASGGGKSVFRRLLAQGLRPPSQRARHRVPGSAGARELNRQLLVEGGGHIRRVVETLGGVPGEGKPLLAELGGFEQVAALYADTPAARQRGYAKDWFLLDSPGGRCTTCEGRGSLHCDLQFLEDMALPCPACEGRRYRPEVLEVTVRGQRMNEILQMSVGGAAEHFRRETRLAARLDAAVSCGLGERRLGESSDQLEPVEYLRLQLAVELVRVSARDVLFLDHPAGSTHPDDVCLLIGVLDEMVRRGASVVVEDNHPQMRAAADWIIEIGPGAGPAGGRVVRAGPLAESAVSHDNAR